jgi:hypothetical protein
MLGGMMKKLSYLTVTWWLLSMCLISRGHAADVFLSPDTVLVPTGIGSEFDVELRVDSTVKSLRLFEVVLAFDPAKLDTVEITVGDFFDTTGALVIFNYYFTGDDTLLHLEGVVMGGGISADGPGLLATMRLKAIDTGLVDMAVVSHSLRDVNNDVIPGTTAEGAGIFINYPPLPFALVSPAMNENVTGFPGDSFDLVWLGSQSIYPGEGVKYRLSYGTSSSFVPESTTVVDNLLDTSYTLYVDDLPQQPTTFFWRVVAVGDIYGFERYGTPTSAVFYFIFGVTEPDPFDLIEPIDASEVDLRTFPDVYFDWEDAGSIIQNDTMSYVFYLGPDSNFPGSEVYRDSVVDVSELFVAAEDIPVGAWLYWQVKAVNKFGLSRWSSSVNTALFFVRGDLNADRKINIQDISFLVVYLFEGGEAPLPLTAADVDCNGRINISDMSFLVSYLFGTPAGPEPYCP